MKTIQDILQPKSRWHQQVNGSEWETRRRQYLSNAKLSACPSCRQSKPLRVHHINYVGGRNLWEYADHELIAICSECHARYHEMFKVSRHLFVKLPAARLSELITVISASFKTRGEMETVGRIERALM